MKVSKASFTMLRGLLPGALLCLSSSIVRAGQVPLPHAAAPVAPAAEKSAPAAEQPDSASPAPAKRPAVSPAIPQQITTIPGPLRSFLRMAGLSQKAMPQDVLPLLAHTIYHHGYRGVTLTEFLILLQRYVAQARELQALAGPDATIRVANCVDATKLLQIIGYRFRGGCGSKDASLETANPERAFLTMDSGFPLTDLEEAIQNGSAFTYPYASARLPILFREADWVSLSAGQKVHYGNILDILLNDPAVGRLYWALSRTDTETSWYLNQRPGLRALMPVAPALDFYGGQFNIRSERMLVPGGAAAEPAWKTLVGASPEAPAAFTLKLLARDDGWLAAYFDALMRVETAEQEHLTQTARLVRNYAAFHSADSKGSAIAHTFRQGSDLLLLDTRLTWEPNGEPHIPGTLAAWKQAAHQRTDVTVVRDWNKHNHAIDTPDQLLESMTAYSRAETETGPLQLYLTLCELDRKRPADRKLSAESVSLLSAKFPAFSHWYPIFTEFPGLADESIAQFLKIGESIEQMHSQTLRANALGAYQANIGLWQIFARQGQIADSALNRSWQEVIEPFAKITSSPQLFDATSTSIHALLRATDAPEGTPSTSPGSLIDRLAGPVQTTASAQEVHDELARRMHAVLEDQQLVPLDVLFALEDGLAKLEKSGEKGSDDLLALAGELRGFELPKPIFTNNEKANWAPGIYVSHHAELQVQTDLTKVIQGPGTRAQLEAARGQLMPFLRDTLVGLNYAYYEPPGAQILHVNPLFVRAHDFLRISVVGSDRPWQPPTLVGAGISAGGGAYLMGSLADLPHALAEAEEDFIVPENVQALIWRELVPDLVSGATLPRWWNITPAELHAVALYQRCGEELIHAAAGDATVRDRVEKILATRMSPQRLDELNQAFGSEAELAALLPRIMPADTFYLGEQYGRLYSGDDVAAATGPAAKELAALIQASPAETEPARLSADFGIPHPVLARSNAREILNVAPFPLSSGYTNRLFGESLESSNLYWARLADEMGYPPAMLHLLVPELTRQMAGKIFASNIEDWPAVMRAMQETGSDLRQGKITVMRKTIAVAKPPTSGGTQMDQ